MTHGSPSGYSCPLTLRLTEPHSPAEIAALFSYDARDPFAVWIMFGGTSPGTEARVTWLVGRDLLRAGLDRPTGDGDIRLGPTSATDVLFLHLRTPTGEALMELSRSALAAFVAGTATLVPFGAEETAIDFDHEVSLLLSDGDGNPIDR
jgi:hypothetical protein